MSNHRRITIRSSRIVSCVAASALLALLAFASQAQAGKIPSQILAGTPGAGSVPGQFNDVHGPMGLAINDPTVADGTTDPEGSSTDGYVYVVESGNHRVQVFDDAGHFQFMFGAGVNSGTSGDPNLCTNAGAPTDVCGAGAEASAAEAFKRPRQVAINQQTGDAYVYDANNLRVQQFTAGGEFIRTWGWGVDDGSNAFQVCEAPADLPCQAGVAGANGGQFAPISNDAMGMAIDPAAPHHVFVGDKSNQRLQEFDVDGDFVRLWGWDVVAAGQTGDLGTGIFEICQSMAAGVCKTGLATFGPSADGNFLSNNPESVVVVGATGMVYATGGSGLIQRFDSDEATPGTLVKPRLTCCGSGPLLNGNGPLSLEPSTGHLLASRGSLAVQALDVSTEPTIEVDRHLGGFGADLSGLAVNAGTGDFYFTSGNRLFLADDTGPPPASPTVIAPADVDSRSATLSGTVNSNGLFTTDWRFELSPDGLVWDTVGGGTAPGGTSPEPVSVEATDLRPNTAYQVRLVVRKQFVEEEVFSAPISFLTDPEPPELSTVRADSVQDTSARLSGRINPHSSNTSYRFEWGQGNFDNKVPVPDGVLSAGPHFVFVGEQLTGLKPSTTYQFRLVAANLIAGQTAGAIRTFTTRAAPLGDDRRAFELVSPADKAGAVGLGDWYNGLGATAPSGFGSYEGERYAPRSHNGGVLLDDSPFAFANEVALTERVSDTVGWQTHPSVSTPASGGQNYRNVLPTGGASEDLSLIGWETNGGMLKPFPEMADWTNVLNAPLYLGDWQGRWELFGPTDLDQVAGGLGADGAAAFAADGDHVLMDNTMRGLGGPQDPSLDLPLGTRSVYINDVSAGLSNSYPGTGFRRPASVCSDETTLPARVDVGGVFKLGERQCPDPAFGREEAVVSPLGSVIQSGGTNATSLTERMISADGSRAYFMSPNPAAAGVPSTNCTGVGATTVCPRQLYLRQKNADGSMVTRWISRPEEGMLGDQNASLAGQAIFEGASADGSRVFFRTNQPLSADDPNGQPLTPTDPRPTLSGSPSNNSWDLYMFELAPGNDPTGPGSELTRISAGPDGDGDCNSPLGGAGENGALRFVSADGHRAYFTCAAVLPGVTAPTDPTRSTAPEGTVTNSTHSNLYLYDDADGSAGWRFVARLPRGNNSPVSCATTSLRSQGASLSQSGTQQSTVGFREGRCVKGTSDGEFVTLWTPGRLLVDDPDDVSMDFYAYDAGSEELVRITAPQGKDDEPYPCGDEGEAASTDCYGDPGFATAVLPPLGVVTDPLVPDERIAFFQSASRLVAEDEDDAYDVYEWRNGVLSLISTGQSATDGAFYRGNDRSGRNVYFVTRDRLTWQDHDAVLDAYTARVGGGIPVPPPAPACDILGDACAGAGSSAPPSLGAASAAFQGPGNPAPRSKAKPRRCGKGKVRRGKRCVGKAKKKARRAAGRERRVGR